MVQVSHLVECITEVLEDHVALASGPLNSPARGHTAARLRRLESLLLLQYYSIDYVPYWMQITPSRTNEKKEPNFNLMGGREKYCSPNKYIPTKIQ